MYRLLIADDEVLEREGLELMVGRLLPGKFEIYHADNGRKAIQVAEEHRPDIIFMDIKMPGIQGLEAIKEILKRHTGAKIVLVTAFDYFVYAKEAVALGVKDYILKPAKKEQILEMLQRMISELEEEKKKRQEELELKERLSQLRPLIENEFAIMLMLDYVQEVDLRHVADMLDCDWSWGYAMVFSLVTDQAPLDLNKKECYESIKSYIKPQLPCLVSPLIGSQLALFVPSEPGISSYSHRIKSLQWGKKLQDKLEAELKLSSVIGIGSIQEGIEGLRQSYHQAMLVSTDPTAMGSIRHYDDVAQGVKKLLFSLNDEKQLFDAVHRLHKQEAHDKLTVMLDKLGRNVDLARWRKEITYLFESLTKQFLQQGIKVEAHADFSSVCQIEELRQASVERLDELIRVVKDEREKRSATVIDRAKAYIDDQYREEISMEQVAEYVSLSPYYFSKLFKVQIGETFIDYLTQLRIEEAKKLMLNPEYSLKEICYDVGYKDPNYFSRVFKKVTGTTPKEYRQNELEEKSWSS
ncbi:helix-turn-helix domain-containing protein [Ammoniphilus sp. YIM 78166]|uniref:helix-turn-helix domain-containing protein n=1 Tax=Ammoniphilus sp. YIM 78166 TaxID=1644106 RepID=UPI0010705817|nr:helix-turn-helix domain-containing protein [Ammoniphilus sp. YIM 78166]